MGSGWLAALAPLRAQILAGDLRLFHLLWLTAVESEMLDAGEPEPSPTLKPMSATLEAFAEFFAIDADLVQAAAERPASATATAAFDDAARKIISAMSVADKTAMLSRLFEGDPHVAAELRAQVGRSLSKRDASAPPVVARIAGELRERAEAIGLARRQAAATERAAESARQAAEAENARQARLLSVAQQGDAVWDEVETEIERRNASAYDRAAGLLRDLHAVANERGATEDFRRRLRAIRERHVRKERFLERLTALG